MDGLHGPSRTDHRSTRKRERSALRPFNTAATRGPGLGENPSRCASGMGQPRPRSASMNHSPSTRGRQTRRGRTGWPLLPGTYTVPCYQAPVAVCTPTDDGLAAAVAREGNPGVAIVGTLHTENLGIERVVTSGSVPLALRGRGHADREAIPRSSVERRGAGRGHSFRNIPSA